MTRDNGGFPYLDLDSTEKKERAGGSDLLGRVCRHMSFTLLCVIERLDRKHRVSFYQMDQLHVGSGFSLSQKNGLPCNKSSVFLATSGPT